MAMIGQVQEKFRVVSYQSGSFSSFRLAGCIWLKKDQLRQRDRSASEMGKKNKFKNSGATTASKGEGRSIQIDGEQEEQEEQEEQGMGMGWVKEELKEKDDGGWLLWCEPQKQGE